MLSVNEALEKLLSGLPVSGVERIALRQAHGRVLAADVHAQEDAPPFDNSSMDGFAVVAADLQEAGKESPRELQVVGDIPAGHAPQGGIEAGQSMRIMTGAVMPPGADAVVPVEETDADVGREGAPLPERVKVMGAVEAGAFVRPKGQDFAAGQKVLEKGRRLRAQDVAMLASLGVAQVEVHERVKAAIFSSGDELLEVDEPLAPGKIRESNSYALEALAQSCGAEAFKLGIAPDDLDEIKAQLDRAVEQGADLILSSAGVSVGAFDFLRAALESEGELDFWRVNMRPGKPLTFGRYKRLPFVGFPGNPVSAFASFQVFGRPALEHMSGVRGWQRLIFRAVLDDEVRSGGRQSYLRGRYRQEEDALHVELTGHQGSGNLYGLVQANCFVLVPAGVEEMKSGETVEVWPF